MGGPPTNPGAALTFLRHAGCPALCLVATEPQNGRIQTESALRRGGPRAAGTRPVQAESRLPESRGGGQAHQGPWGTRSSNGALSRPVNPIALPRCDAAADAESTVHGRETCSPIASDGPCMRAIQRWKATDEAQAHVPIHVTFARPDQYSQVSNSNQSQRVF
jgi:hypothetical protein